MVSVKVVSGRNSNLLLLFEQDAKVVCSSIHSPILYFVNYRGMLVTGPICEDIRQWSRLQGKLDVCVSQGCLCEGDIKKTSVGTEKLFLLFVFINVAALEPLQVSKLFFIK